MDPSTIHETVDLSQFSAAECSKIWEVLQRDFQVRYQETRNINQLQSRVAQANEKINLLGDVDNFNDKYCIVCFDAFVFIINPSYECFSCLCNVCKKCCHILPKPERRICLLCEEEKYLIARQCSWFYSSKQKTFVVNDHPTALTKDRLDRPVSRSTSSKDSSPNYGFLPNGRAMPPDGDRDETGEALKRITGMQIMRFQQKMNGVASEVRTFLRDHVCYEIPEPGIDRHYDAKVKAFNDEVIDILRNFSQTLYIAIEGYHSRTGKPLQNVHQEVLFILQDEVENLVGYRVDIRQDDEVASMVSDDEVASSLYGPGNIQERLSQILVEKWLADHQIYLEDQKVTASDLYTQNALEDVISKKTHDSLDFRRLSLEDEWQQAEEEMLQSRRSRGVFGAAPMGLNEVDPDMLSLQDSRSKVFGAPPMGLNEVDPDMLSLRDSRQLDDSLAGSSSGPGNWLLRGRPNVTNSYGESMHHFDDPPTPRIGSKHASELSDELSANEESEGEDEEEVNSFLSQVEKEHVRKKSTASIDFDDVYNQNLTIYSDSSPEKAQEDLGVKSEDSGVHVSAHSSSSPVTRVESMESEGSGKARKVSLGFLKMDWSFSEHSDPCFISKTTEVSCKVAECASITVEVDGTMPIDVYWYRASRDNLQQLEENDRIEFVAASDHPGKHTLHVWHVEEDDEGEYLAVAVNQQGSNKQGFKITVLPNDHPLQAPEFQRPLSGDEVRKSETGRLRCKVTGHPHPRVVFMRDGSRIQNNDKYQLMKIGERAYTLSIHDVQAEDKGLYSCIATNAAGTCRSEASLDIITAPSNVLPRVDKEMLVDTSPAVNVRSQVQKLGKEEGTPGPHLFIDKTEPPEKSPAGRSELRRLPGPRHSNSLPSRRKDNLDGGGVRKAVNEKLEATRAAVVNRSPSAGARLTQAVPKKAPDDILEPKTDPVDEQASSHDLILDIPEDQRLIDCGLKPVSSRYKRDFHLTKPTSGSDQLPSPLSSTSSAKRIELKLRAPQPESPAPASPAPESNSTQELGTDILDTVESVNGPIGFSEDLEQIEETECIEERPLEPEFNATDTSADVIYADDDEDEEEHLSIAQRRQIGWNPWVSERGTASTVSNITRPRRHELEWNPSSPVNKEEFGDRRNSIELEEDVNSLKERFEKGIISPHTPNPYASFRTRKFPSVAAIKSQLATPPPRGSYMKREPSTPKYPNNSQPRRSKTLPTRPSPQSSVSSTRSPKSQSIPRVEFSAASNSSKDGVVVPEFFNVKLKPTGRQIND